MTKSIGQPRRKTDKYLFFPLETRREFHITAPKIPRLKKRLFIWSKRYAKKKGSVSPFAGDSPYETDSMPTAVTALIAQQGEWEKKGKKDNAAVPRCNTAR